MKVLFILPILPHPNAFHAGAVCAWYLIQHVCQRHEGHIVLMGKDFEASHLNDLAKIAQVDGAYLANTTAINRLKSVVSQMGKLHIPARDRNYLLWQDAVSRSVLQNHYDVIHVDFFQTSKDVPVNPDSPMVLSCHDVWLKLELRKAGVPEKDFCHPERWPGNVVEFNRYEEHEFSKYSRIIVHSNRDRELLLCASRARVELVHPVGQVEKFMSVSAPHSERIPKSIAFVGALDRKVNQDAVAFFAEQVMPMLRERVPEATFHVYGANAPSRLHKICDGRLSVYHGYEPNLEKAYLRHEAAVSPLFLGGGLILKNLQAMATGTPLVTTSVGNEGIEAEGDKHILLADDAKMFVEQFQRLFNSDEVWERLSIGGRQFVADGFSWKNNAAEFERILEEAAAGGRKT